MQSQNPSLSVHLPVYSRFLAISKDCRHDHGHLCRSVNISNILSSICASHLFLNKIVAMVIFTPPCKSTWSSFQDVLWDWQEMLKKTLKKLYAVCSCMHKLLKTKLQIPLSLFIVYGEYISDAFTVQGVVWYQIQLIWQLVYNYTWHRPFCIFDSPSIVT